MIIYLYLQDKYMKFYLPSQVIGSYTFDEKDSEEDKLINVDAKENDWVLYSTNSSKIISGGSIVNNVILKDDSFYVLQRNNKQYLIYVTNLFNDDNKMYSYSNDLNIVIGNTNECNVFYPNSLLTNLNIKIHYNNEQLFLEKSSNKIIYKNSLAIKEMSCNLNIGDQIEIYGLRIYILNNMIIINKDNKIKINLESSKLNIPTINAPEQLQEVEIKDQDLYKEEDYYLKSPRLRRLIATKDIKLASPPQVQAEKETPLILTIGPMFTMGITSAITLLSTLTKIYAGETTAKESITALVTGITMLLSTILWPLLTKFYSDFSKKHTLKRNSRKYKEYLEDKKIMLEQEEKTQREILNENLLSVEECANIIKSKGNNFWDKRIDQNDFLNVRVGKGDIPLDINLDYQEEDFTLDHNKLKQQIEALVFEYEKIRNVPIGYSFYENDITAILGNKNKTLNFMDNMLLQLLTYYTYEDLKIVLFTNNNRKDRWQYLKYLNHNFNNERDFRFFGTDYESSKNVIDYLSFELSNRMAMASNNQTPEYKPYYLVIVDGYDNVKHFDFVKEVTEAGVNLGFSLVILEEKMGNLPSKCSNFISIGQKTSGILKNSYEKQEQISFNDEINTTINMMSIAKTLSNIPIEFEEGIKQLPDAITFLEMEKVGKVEQLNILNRWKRNDSTQSLKAEVGVDENGELIYLDLHEKYHGPHGLIAGTTGSGKSEFIITYILSMCMNYSPDDVSFILIDYKGGGLALAFENKATGVYLPHLAGTITNLDKAEMDRTLVSIDSEVKRRQKMFNEARDLLGESTIDIYKYQRLYKEGKLKEPISHLFIICDEFAELKAQQPDFMDNLISVARIGRSLGVHLILATQKPSGVVNDQIWSNTKFRVCLKVQDESDSKEMLKRPDAASIKQTGRFYLQVGMDELFLLGQSGWCGAKYFPSDKIVKQVDKSINFINDCGIIVKSAEAGSNTNIEAQGEQISAIMNNIIEVSNRVNMKAKRLWLENIDENIIESALQNKYNVEYARFNPKAIIGEYDAPEEQVQGVVTYDFLNDGNTIIYGFDGAEREKLLDTMVYSSMKNYSNQELNYYMIDYGSESLRKFSKAPHVGGIVYAGEDEKYHNLFKLIKEELQKRKKLFADYGGEYKNYIQKNEEKLPVYAVILNNWDSIYDSDNDLYEEMPDLLRDSERYGVVFIITCSATNSIPGRVSQNCTHMITLKLKDSNDYSSVFGKNTKLIPRDMFARGLIDINGIHEFQTASIISDGTDINDFMDSFIKEEIAKNPGNINKIPTLPDIVRFNDISSVLGTLNSIPIGIDKNELEPTLVDFTANPGNIISSNKLVNTDKFVKSLIMTVSKIPNFNTIVFDVTNTLNVDVANYFVTDFDDKLSKVNNYINKLIEDKQTMEGMIIIYGVDKILSKLDDTSLFEQLFEKVKKYEHISVVIVDDHIKLKKYAFENWFSTYLNTNDGIWIGRGITEQSLIRIANMSKEMTKNYKNDMGYYVSEGVGALCRLIDFITEDKDEK